MARYRVGIVGFAHMHIMRLVDHFNALGEKIQWVACADTVPTRPSLSEARRTRRANLKYAVEAGVPKVYDDYREMLEKEQFDFVIACPENARHGEVTEAIAAAGAHVITEKPPAASFDEMLRMVRATRDAGVELIVNWPSTWSPAWRLAKQLVDSGQIGRVFQFKWRAGSRGPIPDLSPLEKGAEWWHRAVDGGGALLDYCCYGANLSRWVIGQPAEAVVGLRGNFASHFGDADDNAALLVRYPAAMAILEATWSCVNHGVSALAVIYGTEGTIALERQGGVRLFQDGGEGVLHTPEPLPEGGRTVAEEFLRHLETGDPVHETLRPEINLDAMAILDAGIRSAQSGHLELVRSWVW